MNVAHLMADCPTPARRVPRATTPEERLARLRLARSENVGPRTFLHLLGRFGTGERAVAALPDLAARGGRAQGYGLCTREEAEAEMAAGVAAGAELVLLGDRTYPPALLEIDNQPPALWLRGDAGILARRAVAVVGARNASALGLRTARRLARAIGEADFVIVSGLARGIDAAAHEAAIESGTIGVLAGGIDRVYPAENAALAERIVAEGGALVSECPMGMEPTSRHFPRRNRLVSGLAEGVLLIEAAMRSGSLITARFALDQGREVMACPGAPEDPRSGGCNQLIREGAALIRDGEDVIEALSTPRSLQLSEEGSEFLFDADSFADDMSRDDMDALADFDFDLDEAEDDEAVIERILALLGASPVDMDELARAAGASHGEISLALLELELAGRVTLMQGGLVARVAEG